MSAFADRLDVPTDGGHVTVHRRPAPGRPAMLLVHGTGFCASTWIGFVRALGDEFDVYALDRRGHGSSSAPPDAYDITDFARDAARVVDALGLRDAYGVGHSAGATDLLLAAAGRPHAFARLYAMEPTAMDPAEPGVRADMAAWHAEGLALFGRRRAAFASRDEAIERYTGRGAFEGWRRDVLEAYVRDGFADADDGSVVLRCTPATEVAMLRHVFAVMEGVYRAGDPDHPFDDLRRVTPPTFVATTEHSMPIFAEMAAVVRRLVPHAQGGRLDGLGHSAVHIDPDRVAADVLRFWRTG